MLNCLEPECIGWNILPSDQFCSWCGNQLAEISLFFEEKRGERWARLEPAMLVRDVRPALRLVIAHTGYSGAVPIDPSQLECSVSWMGLDLAALKPTVLEPEELVTVAINRLKVPGKEDSFQEVQIRLVAGGLSSQVSLLFVPAPVFHLELASETILLLPDEEAVIDASLRLSSGRVLLGAPPEFRGRWVELEPDCESAFPQELDSRGRSRLALRLRVKDETVQQLRESALGRQHENLRRGGMVVLPEVAPRVEGQTIELPIEVGFLLGPELYLEPFRESSRVDITRLSSRPQDWPIQLRVSNGTPGTRGRVELVVRYLDIDVDWLTFEAGQFPLTIPSGEVREVTLKPVASHQLSEATARLSLVSNDPTGRDYYLRLRMLEPEPYPGWLVVDLGTSNTCAALVDANQACRLVPLERSLEPTTLPSVLCYLELVRRRLYEAGTWAWERSDHPAADRSVVVAAKRYLGRSDHAFEVVPVDEPAETVELRAREAVADLMTEVFEQATHLLAQEGDSAVLLNRVLMCHPSRFSVHQIEDLKQAVRCAQERVLAHHSDLIESSRTMQEPIGAALDFLNRWQSHAWAHEREEQDETDYTLLVYDLGGGTLDITLIRVRSRRHPRSLEDGDHLYSYLVEPAVLGATGDRWLGGEDMTAVCRELMIERFLEAVAIDEEGEVLLPLGEAEAPELALTGRRNESVLRNWSEKLKVLLSEGASEEALRATFSSLHFWIDGSEQMIPATFLWKQAGYPSLEQIEERIEPRLQESMTIIRRLLETHKLSSPQVVLRVGRASKLPLVQRVLEATFPEARHEAPELAKQCVVLGAATFPIPGQAGGGIQLSRGSRRPGVRVRLSQSLKATTSRLGVKVVEAGKAYFYELIPAGVPVPKEGLRAQLEGMVLREGLNHIPILENSGYRDRLVLESHQPNPDISLLYQATVEVPAGLDPFDLDNAVLEFCLSPELELSLEVRVANLEPIELATLPAEALGTVY